MAKIDIDVYSHYYRLDARDDKIRQLCMKFASRYITYSMQGNRNGVSRVPDKVYAASNADRTEFRFHINTMKDFKDFLAHMGYPDEEIDFISHPYTPKHSPNIHVRIRKGWEARDYQVPVIDYITDKEKGPNRLITLPTGMGKSFVSMQAAANLGLRTLYLLRPAFMDKWVDDLLKTYDIQPTDIAVVKGSGQLTALLALFNNPRHQETDLPKFIILSNKTYQNYIKTYEQLGNVILDTGYDCKPEDLYEHLGVGIRFIDEVHLDFHLNFKADLYTNIPYTASMTASLITSDADLSRMYNVAYPADQRYKAPPPKKYIEARGLLYKTHADNITTTWAGRKEYSHGAYEEWLMKKEHRLMGYFDMVKHVIDGEYIANYRKDDRLLVFCYSIKMATRLSQYLAETYPNHTVERYVEDDEYRNVMEPDMRVSTVLSAGTGIDIPKLRLAILTTAVSSEKSNIQSLGRLRELKDDDRPPVFYWFTNEKIPKHLWYHRAKKDLFQDRTLSVGDRYYDKLI